MSDLSAIRSAYRRMIQARGETVHYVVDDFYNGTRTVPLRARVTGYSPGDLDYDVAQTGVRSLIVLAEDVPDDVRLKRGDGITLRPGTPEQVKLTLTVIDDSTRRVGGELIAYELAADGL